MTVDDDAITILQRENYYNLINGYKEFFLDEDATTERFKPGTSFSDIYDLFLLDRGLRHAFFKWILNAESTLKTVISHLASKWYRDRPEFYLQPEAYIDNPKKEKAVQKCVQQLSELRNSNADSIKHYRSAYNAVPFWVLVNKMTLGTLSHFYSLLKSGQLQEVIAREFGQMYKEQFAEGGAFSISDVRQDLWVLTDFRNVCAHGERFYCHTCKRINIKPDRQADVTHLIKVLKKYLTEDGFLAFSGEYGTTFSRRLNADDIQSNVVILLLEKAGFSVTGPDTPRRNDENTPRIFFEYSGSSDSSDWELYESE
jgi:abortive infection bacteriophage resistance protein